ncbi:hypothetical protein D6T64_18685 [Cryobacterium melibiosiphilum]|uniref:Uncharacterized protein n=1 Tax=Cryobacterium melibiosiphilum TaxID=995039 RepID=A0A3A5MEW0_9MICO|nr:hypothetical protein [Cryobacterium melibiosiphilum]RJT85643.1 hypothetical protein D6T64_18685 [Cryobacterium melibiosiphilum]
MSEISGGASDPLPHGWARLDRAGWWATFAAGPGNVVLVAIVPINLGSAVARAVDISAWWGLLLAVGSIVPLVALLYFVQRLRYPQPWVNFDTGELRAGRRVVPLGTITWARLDMLDRQRSHTRMLTLRFGAESGPRASVRLRNRRGQTSAASVTAVVAEIIRRSTIAVPHSSDDPAGRFARYNFPGSLSRDDVLDVVLNPPTITDPAPVVTV